MPEQQPDTPEMSLIRDELNQVREMITLNQGERRSLYEKRDRLEMLFQQTPRNDIERKILGILSRRLDSPYITGRRESVPSGGRVYDIHFKDVENNIILYIEEARKLWELGFWVESVGTDFMYLCRK